MVPILPGTFYRCKSQALLLLVPSKCLESPRLGQILSAAVWQHGPTEQNHFGQRGCKVHLWALCVLRTVFSVDPRTAEGRPVESAGPPRKLAELSEAGKKEKCCFKISAFEIHQPNILAISAFESLLLLTGCWLSKESLPPFLNFKQG